MDTTAAPEDASRILCPSCVSNQIPWLLTILGGGLLILAWRVETLAREMIVGALALASVRVKNLILNILFMFKILNVRGETNCDIGFYIISGYHDTQPK